MTLCSFTSGDKVSKAKLLLEHTTLIHSTMAQASPPLEEDCLLPVALKTLGRVLSMTVIIKPPRMPAGEGEHRKKESTEQE